MVGQTIPIRSETSDLGNGISLEITGPFTMPDGTYRWKAVATHGEAVLSHQLATDPITARWKVTDELAGTPRRLRPDDVIEWWDAASPEQRAEFLGSLPIHHALCVGEGCWYVWPAGEPDLESEITSLARID
jgi:hypothetical protein